MSSANKFNLMTSHVMKLNEAPGLFPEFYGIKQQHSKTSKQRLMNMAHYKTFIKSQRPVVLV